MVTLIADYPQSKINDAEYNIVRDAFQTFLPNEPDWIVHSLSLLSPVAKHQTKTLTK